MIKATFRNIGPIKHADLELGDLTIIAGQNNTGKTYLVYTLYGFLSFLRSGSLFRSFKSVLGDREEVANIARQMKSTGKAGIAINECAKLNRQVMRRISSSFSSSFISQVFSSPNSAFHDARFNMETHLENGALRGQHFVGLGLEGLSIRSSFEDGEVKFELHNPKNREIHIRQITEMLDARFLRISQASSPEPFILSAERFGISLFYKELDFTKNRLVEELQNLTDEKRFDPFRFIEKESARYAQPIKDNIDFTRDLALIRKQKSEQQADKVRSVETMMDGYYKAKSDEIRFISKRRGENRFDIPLHLASSSVRGVSDLYFYLKHVAKSGHILIVDEPESHLSPTNQILMARLLVFCVNSGLKVLITTHSDYLIKEINNLIMLSNDFNGKNSFLKRYKNDYTENDFLKPESVKAYTCKDGGLQPCSVDKMGIDMPIFDDAIDRINQVSVELSLLTMPGDSEND